mgnify:CR=1 FL=1
MDGRWVMEYQPYMTHHFWMNLDHIFHWYITGMSLLSMNIYETRMSVSISVRTVHFWGKKINIKSRIDFRGNLYRIFLVDLLENYKFATKVNLISPIGSEKRPFENLTRHDPTFFCDVGSCRVKSGHPPELTRHDPTWPQMGQVRSGSFDFWSWPDLTQHGSGRVMLKAWPDVEPITASCPIFT